MNQQEYNQLTSERAELDSLLSDIPETRVLERIGLKSRRDEIEALLEGVRPLRDPVRTRLTFKGRPVVESQGIFVRFGASAVAAFSEAVAAIGASAGHVLGSRGKLPSRDDYRMLITATAVGSFGFELEEVPQANESLLDERSPVHRALLETRTILEATLGSDDDLTEAISDSEPRAIEALRKFLSELESQEAVFAMEFADQAFRFTDVPQLRRSFDRLKQDNIHESEESLVGTFQGVLPVRRTFEFKRSEDGEIISGRVSSEIESPAEINQILDQAVSIRVRSRRAGEGRPRFMLLEFSRAD